MVMYVCGYTSRKRHARAAAVRVDVQRTTSGAALRLRRLGFLKQEVFVLSQQLGELLGDACALVHPVLSTQTTRAYRLGGCEGVRGGVGLGATAARRTPGRRSRADSSSAVNT